MIVLLFEFQRPVNLQAPVRAAAATALAHLGEAGVKAFVEVLEQPMPSKDDEGSLRSLQTAATLHGLSYCSDELCCPRVHLILHRLDDPSKRVQLGAATTLRSLGPLCADAIAQRLKAEDPDERELLVTALGCVGSPNALPYTNMLVALLDPKTEGSLKVQTAAAHALSKCGPETGHAAAVALSEFLCRVADEEAKTAAKQALISLKAKEVLPQLLSHQHPEIKCAAFDLLDSLQDGSEVVKEITACASDKDEKVRHRALQAFLLLKDVSVALELLPRRIEDISPVVSNLAISIIGQLGSKASTLAALVSKQLKDPDEQRRATASWTLGQLGSSLQSSTMKAIITQFRNEKSDEVKSLLIQAIGSQGHCADSADLLCRFGFDLKVKLSFLSIPCL